MKPYKLLKKATILRLEPDDIIVVQIPREQGTMEFREVQKYFEEETKHKCMVIPKDTTIRIIRKKK